MARYAVEWGGAAQLGWQGVTRETLKLGDHLVISGNPGRNPSDHRVRMISLRRPRDGFGVGYAARRGRRLNLVSSTDVIDDIAPVGRTHRR